MKATIINMMTPCQENTRIDINDVNIMAGLNAGICYMPNDYTSLKNEDEEKTLKRANFAKRSGHHSVFDHMSIELILEDIPKVCAMTLNNLNAYTTSEKSGRYTLMNTNDESKKYYDKWKDKFSKIIEERFTNMTDRYKKTLTLENARYMLSVFTPTTMGYTASVRQWQYIIQWCDQLRHKQYVNDFYCKWRDEMVNLGDELKKIVGIYEFNDNKNRSFNLFKEDEMETLYIKDFFSYSYQVLYKGSLAYLAQAQRHRTLDYVAYFNGIPKQFYIPKILGLTDFDLVEEWLEDLNVLYDYHKIVPQATQVYILERGTIENFILKTKERACSEAQLESQKLTHHIHELYEQSENLNDSLKQYLGQYSKKVRCGYSDFKCLKPCKYGIKSPDRLI